MKTIFTLTIATLFAISLTTACQNNSANQAANKATTNANQNTNQANKPETNTTAANTTANGTKSETNTTATSSASTPTAAYKAAYAARKNKDIKALKQLFSKDMFEFFEILGEGKPNPVDEGLKELVEMPQGPSDDTRNEKITGDTATVEYLDQKGEWKTMDFVKEDGSWKLTIAKMNPSEKKESNKKPQ